VSFDTKHLSPDISALSQASKLGAKAGDGVDQNPRPTNWRRDAEAEAAYWRNAMVTLNVNGKPRTLDVPDDMPLLWTLRDVLSMTGTKFGCGQGLCGACTIHIDGQPTRSCITPVSAPAGKKITTIEAVGAMPAGKKIQAAWRALDVPQCGYCQSGQIMSASALLAAKAKPSDADIDGAMAGNICRCGTYSRIRAAIKHAAGLRDAEV
jgi:isoquinoline 1-oxidoreductase alpha subunit